MNFAATAGIVATLTQALTAPLPVAVPVGGIGGGHALFPAQAPDAGRLPAPVVRQPDAPAPDPSDVRLAPRVICGMTVVPVTPSSDPRMVRPVPSDTRYHLRSIAPPVCAN